AARPARRPVPPAAAGPVAAAARPGPGRGVRRRRRRTVPRAGRRPGGHRPGPGRRPLPPPAPHARLPRHRLGVRTRRLVLSRAADDAGRGTPAPTTGFVVGAGLPRPFHFPRRRFGLVARRRGATSEGSEVDRRPGVLDVADRVEAAVPLAP